MDSLEHIRYVDPHLALSYRNGQDWYDIRPLVRDLGSQQAELASKRWRKE